VAGARRLENEVRVGLESVASVELSSQRTSTNVNPLDELSFGKPVRRHVRDFGVLFALIFFGIAAWQVYKGRTMSSYGVWVALGAVFAALGLLAPRVLLPVWRAWMKFAHYLSIVMTSVLLVLTWCLAFLPMSFVLKLVGIRRINVSYRDGSPTYWEKRDPKYDDFKRLELQY
jgi:hypothetical protein